MPRTISQQSDVQLNEGEVIVNYSRTSSRLLSDVEIESVFFEGVNILAVMSLADYEFLLDKAWDWAREDIVQDAYEHADQLNKERRENAP